MQLGVVGLGRMGGAIAQRLMRAGHSCVVFDKDPKAVQGLAEKGATGADSLANLVARLDAPRTVWLMLPAGAVTEETVAALSEHLKLGDVIVEGGNGYYRDDIRRARTLAEKGVIYLDAGVSGGVWGLERGYCLMIGGEAATVERLDPIFRALAPGAGAAPRTERPAGADPRAEQGYIHTGPVGSGHFVKMVHNGIEYGLMQAYAEGFHILEGRSAESVPAEERFDLNVADIAEVWRRGSVVSSWLLDLAAQALAGDPRLKSYTGAVEDSGEGRWTVQAAIEQAVPAEVLSAALYARFRSREADSYADKLLSALRHGFGGHGEATRE
jgi:6-phosphogluconate dehydrogenase